MKIQELIQINKHTDFNTYCKLLILQDMGSYLFSNLCFDDMKLQGYCDFELKLTKKGEELLNKCQEVDKSSKKTDVGVNNLYIACQEELLKLTGKKQKTSKIENKSYSFLPNFIDFQDKLSKTIKKYKLEDSDKLKSVLLQYINKCHEANNWFPILEYYINKDNKSKLATDYFNFEGEEKQTKTFSEITL